MAENELVTGKVERIYYRDDRTGWGVYAMDFGVAKGKISWPPEIGQRLKLAGHYEVSKYNGKREFVFADAALDVPDDPRTLLAYAVDITPGLGSKRERDIWQEYGADWYDTSSKLDRLTGLTAETRERWCMTLDRIGTERVKVRAVSWLMGRGATRHMAEVAWEYLGESMQGKVEADPYCLTDLPHYGFCAVDERLACHFGIAHDDARRAVAAIKYVIKRDTDATGDTVLPMYDVIEMVERLNVPRELAWEAMKQLVADEDVHHFLASNMVARREDVESESAIYRLMMGGRNES